MLQSKMADFVRLNRLKTSEKRNSYFIDVNDIISPVIKKQLECSQVELETNSDKESSSHLEDESGDGEHLYTQAYYYDPEEHRAEGSSKEALDNVDTVKTVFTDQETTWRQLFEVAKSMEDNDFEKLHRTKSQSSEVKDGEDDLVHVPTLDFAGVPVYQSRKMSSKLDSKTNRQHLTKLFENLEKNLSDVRKDYQVSLSNSSMRSSARKQDYRLLNSSLSFNSTNRSSKNTAKSATNGKLNTNDVCPNNNLDKNFDLNKWYEDMPEGLKNFVEIEQENKTRMNRNSLSPMNRNQYLTNIQGPLSKSQTVTPKASFDASKQLDTLYNYFEGFKKDYYEPIKHTITKEINQLVFDEESESDEPSEQEKNEDNDVLKPKNDVDLYYMESNTSNCYMERVDTKEGLNRDDEVKTFNIYDKYQCFDISDEKPKLTHVASIDKVDPLYMNEGNEVEDTTVVKSVGDYQMGFLSNLSWVQEKCDLLKDSERKSNQIRPWFVNPINEKMVVRKAGPRLGHTEREESSRCVCKNNVKYVIKTGEVKRDSSGKAGSPVKYTIAKDEQPDTAEEATGRCKLISLKELEKFAKSGSKYSIDSTDSEGNRIYDPILHFKKYEERKKNTTNDTDWALFGRPLVKRASEHV